MPQLDFTSYPSQLFWLAISFSLLYFLFARLILPRLTNIQVLRATQTSGKRKNAAQATLNAEKALQLYEKKIAESKAQALKEAKALIRKTDLELNEKSELARTRLEAKTQKAELDINHFLNHNQDKVAQAAANTAQVIVEKFSKQSISKQDALEAIPKLHA